MEGPSRLAYYRQPALSTECPTLLTLVLGGARSGKSRHAEALVTARPPPWCYVATAEAWDDEMRARIAAHRARRVVGWRTVERPRDLCPALSTTEPVLVDCLTLWLSNLMLGGDAVDAATDALAAALVARREMSVLVSNEVGWGIVPENALARAFRDAQGRLNQRMAALATQVILMVAGIPMVVK